MPPKLDANHPGMEGPLELPLVRFAEGQNHMEMRTRFVGACLLGAMVFIERSNNFREMTKYGAAGIFFSFLRRSLARRAIGFGVLS